MMGRNIFFLTVHENGREEKCDVMLPCVGHVRESNKALAAVTSTTYLKLVSSYMMSYLTVVSAFGRHCGHTTQLTTVSSN